MATQTSADDVPLPKTWPANVKSLILQVISLARFAITHTRSWASDSVSSRVRLQASLDRALNEVSMLQDELRVKDARMSRLEASRRPHYRPVERFQILELRAARGWSTAQTARTFQVEPDTIASWMKRVDEDGPELAAMLVDCVDHFSRRVTGFPVFSKEPSSIDTRRFLGRAIGQCGTVPKYLIADKGGQFTAPGFKTWCRRKNMEPRYAATGRRGATSVIERFWLSLKKEWLRRGVVPLRRDSMRRHVSLYLAWHFQFRPHQGLGGQTPKEVYDGLRPANKKARWEPRPKWPKDSRCAAPQAKPKRKQLSQMSVVVQFHEGSRHLPIVEMKRAA